MTASHHGVPDRPVSAASYTTGRRDRVGPDGAVTWDDDDDDDDPLM